MVDIKSKWWVPAFLAIPILYFITQLLPFYHSGSTFFPSLGSVFWFPERNSQTIDFISMFYHGFRVNDLTVALLNTQFFALFLIIFTLVLRKNIVVAFLYGCWGLFGLISFLTTSSLSFSPVMVYGGIAGILMLVLFVAALTLSVLFLSITFRNYKSKVALFKPEVTT